MHTNNERRMSKYVLTKEAGVKACCANSSVGEAFYVEVILAEESEKRTFFRYTATVAVFGRCCWFVSSETVNSSWDYLLLNLLLLLLLLMAGVLKTGVTRHASDTARPTGPLDHVSGYLCLMERRRQYTGSRLGLGRRNISA